MKKKTHEKNDEVPLGNTRLPFAFLLKQWTVVNKLSGFNKSQYSSHFQANIWLYQNFSFLFSQTFIAIFYLFKSFSSLVDYYSNGCS